MPNEYEIVRVAYKYLCNSLQTEISSLYHDFEFKFSSNFEFIIKNNQLCYSIVWTYLDKFPYIDNFTKENVSELKISFGKKEYISEIKVICNYYSKDTYNYKLFGDGNFDWQKVKETEYVSDADIINSILNNIKNNE